MDNEIEQNAKRLLSMTQAQFEHYIDNGDYCEFDLSTLWVAAKSLEFEKEYPNADNLIIRHKNGKTITVRPEPIGWTPPTEEEHKSVMKSVDEMTLTICCQNCASYPYCEDFQRWARGEGASMTHYIMTHDSCPTCGQQTGDEYPTTVKKANGIMLGSVCEGKKFKERVKK